MQIFTHSRMMMIFTHVTRARVQNYGLDTQQEESGWVANHVPTWVGVWTQPISSWTESEKIGWHRTVMVDPIIVKSSNNPSALGRAIRYICIVVAGNKYWSSAGLVNISSCIGCLLLSLHLEICRMVESCMATVAGHSVPHFRCERREDGDVGCLIWALETMLPIVVAWGTEDFMCVWTTYQQVECFLQVIHHLRFRLPQDGSQKALLT